MDGIRPAVGSYSVTVGSRVEKEALGNGESDCTSREEDDAWAREVAQLIRVNRLALLLVSCMTFNDVDPATCVARERWSIVKS